MSDSFYSAALEGEALIHLRGRSIPDFLQGQLTCDLRRLAPDMAVPGAMCNVKGRVISDLWVIAVDSEHCLLRLRRSIADAFATNLERYARFSRISVSIDERIDAITGYFGSDVPMQALGLEADGHCVRRNGCLLLRSGRQLLQQLSLATEADASAPETSGEDIGATLASAQSRRETDWRAQELMTGHLAIEGSDSEQFTPQTLNYDLSRRVAFDKGCYTGQEVVARLHYKGRAKQRLQLFRAPASGAESASLIQAAILDRTGHAIGEILRSEYRFGQSLIVAALLRHDEDRDDLRLADGRSLDRLTPAYTGPAG